MEQKLQRRRDAQKTREAILATAEEHFAKYGFAGARIEKIADEAGYNRSLVVHHYFASKEDLYHAVIRCLKDEKIERLRQFMTPAGFNDDAPLTADAVQNFIEEAIRLTFNQYMAHPKLVRILAWEAAEGWETFNELYSRQENEQWSEEASAFIRRAQAEGIIRPELDPKMVIASVMGCSFIHLLSIPRYQLVFPGADLSSPGALAHAREQIVNLIVHGILVHPKETVPNATGL
ncbi:MAG TPA: TetR family transcriptional regulator [Ktedonobacterales bacterium]|nr:TetR family transcriptional regulator [Ktedonobacterales bacterium]